MTPSGKPRLSPDGQRLTLDLDDQTHEFAALWLRERAPDAETLDPRTGQRLVEAAELPLDLALAHAELDGDALALRFSDGHATRFPLALLRAERKPLATVAPGRTLWEGDLADPPRASFDEAVKGDDALLALLDDLHRYGFVLVSGVPTDEDGMQGLIDRIGPLRRTNWGGIADVKSVADAYDLTMTQRGLEPHTDNPYRDPIPGYIWLHCLTNAADGGDNTLVDGYRAAQLLAERDPAAFDCLTRVSPGFRYRDETTWLESEGPLIELDGQGRVTRVRYSNRTERVEALPAEELARYYAARRAFYELITSDELTVHLKLDPGQMLIMDNYRLLHGRRAYELAGGVRHLRQGYVDRDSTASRRLVLRRRLAETEEVA
ncbi:TauD/TfdA family dioxygenase [Halomonas beimenensis]|uniref:Gamma-butyrobetaine,2-oxoglutarate dioxygenase n=1 Tax=Halomonas beimenensis TaxID=475662 RepID=A0A291P6K2_9GAMM|nr:TauD/TfdA family dioxygenase [Halomonas beimenensis]ATJ82543.1 gamma-butyrobetaine,2-oxoglutarate dioxygenase [Halomonas beimenensis]